MKSVREQTSYVTLTSDNVRGSRDFRDDLGR